MGGYNLVALIFAHEVSDDLTSLVKRLDKQLDDAPPARDNLKWGVFVVFCNDQADIAKQLQDVVAKERLKHVVLCKFKTSAGPSRYRLSPQADLTIVVYNGDKQVIGNSALKKGELDYLHSDAIEEMVLSVLPKKVLIENK